MEKINERMYQANVELVERNKLLEEDKRILQNRINEAIEYIEDNLQPYKDNLPLIAIDYETLVKILKGETDD